MSLPVGTPFPSLDGATLWLNTGATLPQTGRPIIVHFWAMSCPACKMNMKRLQELHMRYEPHGLQVLAIHMPRGPHDLDLQKVEVAATELGITEPCAVDSEHVIGERFQIGKVWPSYFLFDAQGKLRSRAGGALGLKMAENSLRRMLDAQQTEGAAA